MENRRSRLTRLLFQEALERELASHSLADISVRSLCRQADLNRSTFYLHYRSINDLIDETADELVCHFPFADKYGITNRNEIIAAIRYLRHHQRLFLQFSRSGLLMPKLFAIIAQKFANHKLWPQNTAIDNQRFQAVTHYVVSGTNSLVTYWLSAPNQLSIEEVATLITQLQIRARGEITAESSE